MKRNQAVFLSLLAVTMNCALFAPNARASGDAVLSWYAGRHLPQQVSWSSFEATEPERLFRLGYLLSELSQIAYSKDPGANRLGELGFRRVELIHEEAQLDARDAGSLLRIGGGDILGAVIGDSAISNMKVDADALTVESSDGAVRVVSVRGTEFQSDIFDVLLDLNAATIAEDGVTYHHGFYVYASLLYERVLASLGGACEPGGQRVWLTGHSMGGAAAEILALWLERSGCQVDGVVTFAAPLPGKNNMVRAYHDQGLDDRTHRWVHRKDPVPCLPLGPGWANLGHQHTLSDSGFRLDDPTDHCDAGDGSLEARVYAAMLKVYDLANFSQPFEEWLESTAEATGFCTRKKVWRVFLGVITGGGSELTCESLDTVTDVRAVADQLQRAALLLLEGMDFERHGMPQCLYTDRLGEEGEASGAFDSIWGQRMERTWEIDPVCAPPSWTPSNPRPTAPPQPRHCPAAYHCCEPNADGSCPVYGCQPANRECA